MSNLLVRPSKINSGLTLEFPGDKSISHRAAMCASLAQGESTIHNFLLSEDTLHTVAAFQDMGIEASVDKARARLIIKGNGLRGLAAPRKTLYLGNSGTSMRLLLGIAAGQDFETTLTGDDSLSQRPMKRVIEPLSRMGASIRAKDGNFAPVLVQGRKLRGIRYSLPMPSAQVKSAILLAGLYAEGKTVVEETLSSRDHTERMLKFFGAPISQERNTVTVASGPLTAREIRIPGDFSSAAFFIVAATIARDAHVVMRAVGVNPTRCALLEVLRRMGAHIEVRNEQRDYYEPYADIEVRSSTLRATTITSGEIPRLIDELPILMIAATQAKGKTRIEDAGELRVKETDRIASMEKGLRALGAHIHTEGDTISIEGPVALTGGEIASYADHRTAMSFAVAGIIAQRPVTIGDVACINTSFPNFFGLLNSLGVASKIV
jgi:3-phosphoshikimate 1-carboxyvinyltransferase